MKRRPVGGAQQTVIRKVQDLDIGESGVASHDLHPRSEDRPLILSQEKAPGRSAQPGIVIGQWPVGHDQHIDVDPCTGQRFNIMPHMRPDPSTERIGDEQRRLPARQLEHDPFELRLCIGRPFIAG